MQLALPVLAAPDRLDHAHRFDEGLRTLMKARRNDDAPSGAVPAIGDRPAHRRDAFA